MRTNANTGLTVGRCAEPFRPRSPDVRTVNGAIDRFVPSSAPPLGNHAPASPFSLAPSYPPT